MNNTIKPLPSGQDFEVQRDEPWGVAFQREVAANTFREGQGMADGREASPYEQTQAPTFTGELGRFSDGITLRERQPDVLVLSTPEHPNSELLAQLARRTEGARIIGVDWGSEPGYVALADEHFVEQVQALSAELERAEPRPIDGPHPGEAVVDNLRDPNRPKHGRRYYPQLEGMAGAISVIASTTPKVSGGARSAADAQERQARRAAKLARRAAAAKKGQNHG